MKQGFKLRIVGDLGFEVWQDIPEYEGLYQASTYGRIKSVDRVIVGRDSRTQHLKGRILSDTATRGGYRLVILCIDGKRKGEKVHRLVARTFLPNPNKYPVVEHLDCNPSNNAVFNLRWTDNYGNMGNPITRERLKIGTKGSHICAWRGKFGKEHPMSKPVAQYDLNGNLIRTFESTMEVERETGIRHSYVGECCNSRIKTTKGFIFKFI